MRLACRFRFPLAADSFFPRTRIFCLFFLFFPFFLALLAPCAIPLRNASCAALTRRAPLPFATWAITLRNASCTATAPGAMLVNWAIFLRNASCAALNTPGAATCIILLRNASYTAPITPGALLATWANILKRASYASLSNVPLRNDSCAAPIAFSTGSILLTSTSATLSLSGSLLRSASCASPTRRAPLPFATWAITLRNASCTALTAPGAMLVNWAIFLRNASCAATNTSGAATCIILLRNASYAAPITPGALLATGANVLKRASYASSTAPFPVAFPVAFPGDLCARRVLYGGGIFSGLLSGRRCIFSYIYCDINKYSGGGVRWVTTGSDRHKTTQTPFFSLFFRVFVCTTSGAWDPGA